MNRLTQIDKKFGSLYIDTKGIGYFQSITTSNEYYKVVKRLAEYEEIDLDPSRIKTLLKSSREPFKEEI